MKSKPKDTKSLTEVLELMFMAAQAIASPNGTYKPQTIPTLIEETEKLLKENGICLN